MRVTSIVVEHWTEPGSIKRPYDRIITSETHVIYVNYDKQIVLVRPNDDNYVTREIIPLSRVYSIIEEV